jgi:hypothetical protein
MFARSTRSADCSSAKKIPACDPRPASKCRLRARLGVAKDEQRRARHVPGSLQGSTLRSYRSNSRARACRERPSFLQALAGKRVARDPAMMASLRSRQYASSRELHQRSSEARMVGVSSSSFIVFSPEVLHSGLALYLRKGSNPRNLCVGILPQQFRVEP